MKRIWVITALLSITIALSAQEGNWEVYLAQYDKGPGSTLVDMDIKKIAPDKKLPFLFSAGVNFTNCTTDGFPAANEFDKLNTISDSIVALINRSVTNTLVGTFTYQCQRRDYFYVPDTTRLRQQVINLITNYFPGYTPAFNVKPDKEWEAYLTFLYPSETIMEYMRNQKVIDRLVEAGDKLDKPRKVDHWIYFKTEADRNCFIQYTEKENFKAESKEKTTDSPYSFKLQISRTDKVDISSISKITLELMQQAKKCGGDYDGWETFVVK